MAELKPKKPVRRRTTKAGNSPVPTGPVGGDEPTNPACGHGGCGRNCSVRYVGPTSHIRDHHILHAAKGVTHIWSAAIITGFAIVLTAAIAFNSAQAVSEKTTEGQLKTTQDVGREVRKLTVRMEAMEQLLKKVADQCLDTAPVTAETVE